MTLSGLKHVEWYILLHCSYTAVEIEFTRSQIFAAIPGFFFCAWYASKKHWLANNILGLAFCIQVCQDLSNGCWVTFVGSFLILLLNLNLLLRTLWTFFNPIGCELFVMKNCFSFQGIEMLSLGSFKTGAILLVRSGTPIHYDCVPVFLYWSLNYWETLGGFLVLMSLIHTHMYVCMYVCLYTTHSSYKNMYCRLDFLCTIYSGFSSLQLWSVLQSLLMLL